MGTNWTQAWGGGGGGLAEVPAEDVCHFPNPLKSFSLETLFPAPTPRVASQLAHEKG